MGACSRGGYDVPSPASIAPIRQPDCPRTENELGIGPNVSANGGGLIPQSFEVQTVILCAPEDFLHGPRYRYAEHVALASAGLVEALKLPDRADDDAVCPLNSEGPIYLLLVNEQNQAVHVRIPEDECGHYRPEVVKAIEEVGFKVRERFVIQGTPGGRSQ